MDLHELSWLVREKLIKESNGRCQKAFNFFTTTCSTIKLYEFKRTLKRFGFAYSDDVTNKLFAQYDQDKSGDIDIKEFSRALFPETLEFDKQFTTLHLQQQAAKTTQEKWSIKEMEQTIRSKIEQHTSRSSDCFRQAFRIFKKSRGITRLDFQRGLALLGLDLTEAQTTVMFERYDSDHSGDIDLHEFVIGILGSDYTSNSSHLAAQVQHRMNQRMGKNTATFKEAWDEFKERQEVFNASLRMLGFTNLSMAQQRDLYLQLNPQKISTPRPPTVLSTKKHLVVRRKLILGRKR